MTNWLLVSSADNFETSRARGFDIAGMKSRHRRKAERVAPGDRVAYYLVGVKAVGQVNGDYFRICPGRYHRVDSPGSFLDGP